MHAREVKTCCHRAETDSAQPPAWEMLTKVATLFACRYKPILSGDMRMLDYM